MKHPASFLALLVFASLLASCRSPYPKAATSGNMREETISFYLGPVFPASRSELTGHIVATNALDTWQLITVVVRGEVNQPGQIVVPKGTTILGAIRQAGGFGEVAFCTRVRVIRGPSAGAYMLAREPLSPEVPGHYRIWYGRANLNTPNPRWTIDKGARSDAVLEPGDVVYVARQM